MRILVKEHDSVVVDLSFTDEDEVTIGSQPDCSVHLPDARVSPQNVLLTPTEEGRWLIENLDPGNRVMLNSHVLTDRVALHHDDEVVLHDFALRVYLEGELSRQVVEEPELNAEELAKIREFPLPAGSLVRRHPEPVNVTRTQLERVAHLSLSVSQYRDIHDWVENSLNLLLDVFDARGAWVGIRRHPRGELDVQGGKLSNGQPCDLNPIIELLRYRCVERLQHICVRRVREHEYITSAMAVPLVGKRGALGMAYVDRRQKAARFRTSDLDLLSVVGAHLSAKLEDVLAAHEQRTAELSSTEISVVHAIQEHLDPKASPGLENLKLAAYSRSGQENPGDVYDVMKHPDTQIAALLLGHVNATGALLALSMARLHSTFRVGFLHNDPPHALARALNWLMYDERDPSTVDAVFLAIHPQSGRLKYARAGKIGAFIVNADGQPRALQAADAPAIGQARNFEYVSYMEQLTPGETLALYTRGTASCTNAEDQRFGEHRFISLICDGFCQPPATTLQDVTTELGAFFEEGRHPDDISIVLLHRVPD
jgi:serine phosphatase RsbU (regulator of sigma subunit)